MATRGTVRIYNNDDDCLVTIYKHWDAYPEGGLGDMLRNFCEGAELTNGVVDTVGYYNGIGCFAASLIEELKEKKGDVYIVPFQFQDEEYNYEIKENKAGDGVLLTCKEEPDFGSLKTSKIAIAMQSFNNACRAAGIAETNFGDSPACGCEGIRKDAEKLTDPKWDMDRESSVIKRAVYDWPAKLLDITFKESGLTYRYFDVEQGVYYSLTTASSKGVFFNENIRGRYKHEKVD
jgi:hypothetical protein